MELFAELPKGEIIVSMTEYNDSIIAICESGNLYLIDDKGQVRLIVQ